MVTHEASKYIFFGALATLVYFVIRTPLFYFTKEATFSAVIAHIIAIIFAFFTNDYFVFNQKRQGWLKRFIQFFIARLSTLVLDLALAFLLVDQFPHIIGQFVGDSHNLVNFIETIISQFLIMATNYIISKFFIFKNKKES
ncbi:GtrA-like membrane protein [Streptococcus macacae NCTC 11558]|uniref:GtrA-like protein n=2 Tax=Streptococcus macacae TaxID=1339 RepID=G5JWK6_9STRE|nr:GtrA-like protein [Streptococcus macacae NCTC 11558]SUN78788.1 GtrA-like membrane protein [Streptococcus macacae NCTC 11558]